MTDHNKFDLNKDSAAEQLPAMEPLKCDIEKYREHIESFDLSREEEAELLKNLWLIMAAFVDIGFGVDSIQLLQASAHQQYLLDAESVEGERRTNSKGVTHDD